MYPTDEEEYDNNGIPAFDYGALVEESEEMENNNEKVNLILLISLEQNHIQWSPYLAFAIILFPKNIA